MHQKQEERYQQLEGFFKLEQSFHILLTKERDNFTSLAQYITDIKAEIA